MRRSTSSSRGFLIRSSMLLALCAAVVLAATWTGPARAQEPLRQTAIGLEAGLPIVFGAKLTRRFSPRWRGSIGFGRLSGLTSVKAEGQWFVMPPGHGRVAPLMAVGGTQYFLKDGDDEATPVGVHAAIGVDYFMDTPVTLGARIGVMRTFGSSDGDDVSVFSVKNDYTTALFNLGVLYHF